MLPPAILAASLLAIQLPVVAPHPGLVIDHSVRVKPGTYRLSAPASLDSAVIVVRGDDVTVDMRGVSLVGLDEGADPDRAAGVAIRVDGGRRITIRGARVRGYKAAILARGTRSLRLWDNDLSDNWKPRLFSQVEHESLVDWLSFHHDERDEWLRYGAAIYLDDVHGGEIRGNRAERGMNGLMMARSDSLRVWNNVFSFDSGLGIGLYRSSDNTIMHNHVDYDVRGYSHGFYRRGQDSAGILLYEQSCRNVIAYNSVTHGGDGFFLWAGQQTMDTGEGGANDNLVYGNDFSFAPTNAIEATFSRNTFVGNRAEGADHGLWGGYSHDSRVLGNRFADDRVGIAIEHGQSNEIGLNVFDGDSVAIDLWADSITASDWGYPEHHDTRSRDYRIHGNAFLGNHVAVHARNTSSLHVSANAFAGVESTFVLADTTAVALTGNTVTPGTGAAPVLPPEIARLAPAPMPGGLPRDGDPVARLPRGAIVVDEWGPYDYRSPKLWPIDSTRSVPLRLRVLGPSGRWRVVGRRGIADLSATSGKIGGIGEPDTITVTPHPDSVGNWLLTLEYRGAATVSPRGERHPAGAPYRFSYGRWEPPVAWTVRWHAWTDDTDPRAHPAAFDSLLAHATPVLEQRTTRLDYEWYRPTIGGIPAERAAFVARGSVELPAGEYTLRAISDDAVRVWVDDSLVIDDWTPHESRVSSAPLPAGRHALRVEYVQVDGWTEMRLEVLRK
ncbi:MAG TPA: NosD domain-containing protein [Gemmatimonadaceae bacterium]